VNDYLDFVGDLKKIMNMRILLTLVSFAALVLLNGCAVSPDDPAVKSLNESSSSDGNPIESFGTSRR
jgi:hypothetical protein